MSSIDKMTVQGIRSFGPRDQDTQLIQFFNPVTLIVGPNGSGKTTIIECLKYATTGDLPPLGKGGAFVFDPKLLDEIESKGRIKLYIRSANGQYMQVQKNLSVTQKAKKAEFRTLETVISRYDKELKLLSTITSKCINADHEIITALGVSKAVLDNVIFCHQEDSNWPLSDGKTLKTKFDEVFSATKYIKALDTLRKIRVEKQHSVKQFETEKKHLEVYKKKSEELSNKLSEHEAKREACESKVELIKNKLKPIEDALDETNRNARRINELQLSLESAKNEKYLLEKQMKEIESTIKEMFEGTDEELKHNIDEFQAFSTRKENQVKEIDDELRELYRLTKNYTYKKSTVSTQIGALENENKNYLLNYDRFKSKFNILVDKINYTDFDCTKPIKADDGLVRPFIRYLDQYIEDYECETNKMNFQEKKTESSIEAQLNGLRDKNSKIEQSITIKSELIEKNLKEITRLNRTLKEFDGGSLSIDNLNRLEEKINDCEADLESYSKENDTKRVKCEIESLTDEKATVKKKLDRLNRDIDEMHENTTIQAQIEMLKNDRKTRLVNIEKLKKDNEENFLEFYNLSSSRFSALKNSELKQQYDEIARNLHSYISTIQVKNKELNRELNVNESKLTSLNEELHNKENQFLEYEGKLQNLGNFSEFDSIQKDIQEQQKNYLDEKGFLNGVEKTYTRFIKQLQTPGGLSATTSINTTVAASKSDCDKLSCPVCTRSFNTKKEADEIVVELKKYISKIPRKILDLDEKIQRANEKYESVVKLTPIKELYEILKKQDLPQLRKQIAEIKDVELKRIRASLRQNECELRMLEERKQISDGLLKLVLSINQYTSEINELDKRIEKIESSMKSSFDKTLDDVKQERAELQEKFNEINDKCELKRKMLRDFEDKLCTMKEKLNNLKNEKLNLGTKMQEQKQMQIKLVELKHTNESEQKEIEKLKDEVEPILDEMRKLDVERKTRIKQREENMEKRKAHSNEINLNRDEIEKLIKSIKHFEMVDQKRLNELRASLTEIDELERDALDKQERLKIELEEVKNDLNRQEMKKREFEDNKRLRDKRKELKEVEKVYLELNKKIGDVDLKNVRQEKLKLETKIDDLRRDLAQEKAVQFSLDGTIKTLKSELHTEQYENADEKFKVCATDLRVLELSVQDIDKYYKALDRAIMNYHNMKMDEINKMIKQLWKQVYRGTDIDYIEIRSEDEAAKDSDTVKTRRTYNYRVVLVKGDTVLDMRGRCSCGQKVLASIIIRLALAETFCLNCGILALDEPTTNLDRDNIESLASALVEIIKARSVQKNFQLIIITHDEDFVELLGRSDFLEEFYRVYKDPKGFSRISRKDVAYL